MYCVNRHKWSDTTVYSIDRYCKFGGLAWRYVRTIRTHCERNTAGEVLEILCGVT